MVSLTPAELDRLGGKTHLIAQQESNTTDRPPSNKPSPSSSDMDTTTTTTPHPHFTFDSNIERMYMENLHPRIIQDMKAFNNVDDDNDGYARRVGLEFLYDLPPQPLPPPQSDTYPMAGVNYQDASIYGTDLFVHPFSVSTSTSTNMSAGGGYQQSGTGLVAPATLSHGPPVLDTTWQSFVEQLGF